MLDSSPKIMDLAFKCKTLAFLASAGDNITSKQVLFYLCMLATKPQNLFTDLSENISENII